MTRAAIAAASLSLLSTTLAHAATFSFAGDTADREWMFLGGPDNQQFKSGLDMFGAIEFCFDDGNGPLPLISQTAHWSSTCSLNYLGTISLGNGDYAHSYRVEGQFRVQGQGVGLIASFANALFTVRGGEQSWYTGATFGSDSIGEPSLQLNWFGDSHPEYGLVPGPLVGNYGFQYTLSMINTSGVTPYDMSQPGVQLSETMYPTGEWFAESSFSAYGGNVPSPGSLVLASAASLLATRRQRA